MPSVDGGGCPALSAATATARPVIATIGPNGALSLSSPQYYRVKARTLAEGRRIVTDLKRKHPEIDIDATMASAQMVETYPQGAVRHGLTIGGELAGRSMVKSTLAWAFARGVDWGMCKHAVDYLRSVNKPPCFGYYHDTDLIEGRSGGRSPSLPGGGRRSDIWPDPRLWRIFRRSSLRLPSRRRIRWTSGPEGLRRSIPGPQKSLICGPHSVLAGRHRRHLCLPKNKV
jgi:hypothetical protein